MRISRESFFEAVLKTGISKKEAELLWNRLGESRGKTSLFSKFLYYLGAIIVLLALTWLMVLNWDEVGGGKIALIALIYAILFNP